ncbi:ribonucleotide reductase of class Ia (aerobic), beta subunit [Caulobacter phage C1]|nr:ribonucleotide reductase of class Ia (aerobic), beta subunit [Caulobacter phage C1]UTU08426.1 ribonucleotide reductase of class Ia (aerobic), beta subunit [Caulobacter phage C2]UTU08943.1 ribonucleotide reductase of class Ia (aerobic), beta subunit [Caulobacter phage J4]UTU09499.1 ribonucleotide reductase of class Ia (aerobic), beta subunit [Caulobacter phage BL47]UTU10059.1 ribonucleotide reductase of class Ia (aerobic), beta subunit [Caulobacter phage RB23]WGN97094.1 ribonucleotide reduct
MSLLEPRDYYKPFNYAWAYDAFKKMRAMAWEPHEAPMADDVKDWRHKLVDDEREFLTQLFRFFTQADIDIAKGYRSKYMPRFEHPEIQMMFAAFVDAEANHIDAYSTLMETLGISEGEYKAFHNYKAMREKHEYLFERSQGKSLADLAVDIAIFSAFGEGMQLFSSFALLMSFQRRGLMKGMTTIVEWSIRDETHHVESMIKLFHELVKEHPRIWNDETKARVYQTCRDMVDLEDAFIDQAFGLTRIAGVTPEETKAYIRYIADRRLLQLGLKPNYDQKTNPFEWLEEIMNLPTHTNFFEQRSTEYSKGEIEGWDEAFELMSRGFAPAIDSPHAGSTPVLTSIPKIAYIVHSKPGCPHCDRAKALLDARKIVYVSQSHDTDETRFDLLSSIKTEFGVPWRTFPAIIDLQGFEPRFVGGADALTQELAR